MNHYFIKFPAISAIHMEEHEYRHFTYPVVNLEHFTKQLQFELQNKTGEWCGKGLAPPHEGHAPPQEILIQWHLWNMQK